MTRVVAALARRALRTTARRPQFVAPLVLFPTLFLAANVGGLTRATSLPGFPPVPSFLDFQLAGSLTQALLLGGVASGIAIALEIEMGFFDRLLAAPIPRVAIVLGRLCAAAVVALGQVAWFLAVDLAFGGSVEGGPLGALAVAAIGVVAGVGFGATGITIALLARNVATVQGVFPLVFVILFGSSAFFPRDLLQSPAREVARYNPLSLIADGLRDPLVGPVSAGPVLEGLAAAGGVAVVMTAACVLALRRRLARA
ncbi:MAG: ABC transporter permease [Solirubrobacteraceae bacterium]|nr:ABC transporter permease [Solirubrobacteraceae bacterium]